MKYHTGLDLKAAQDTAPRHAPHGRLSNPPVAVDDDLAAIVLALGENPDQIDLSDRPAAATAGGDFR